MYNGQYTVCVCLCVCLCVARNKDNSWPEEIIAVMKEVRAKDKENKENKETDKHQESSESDMYQVTPVFSFMLSLSSPVYQVEVLCLYLYV